MRRGLYPYCKIDFSEVIGGLSAECDNDFILEKIPSIYRLEVMRDLQVSTM